jgi:Uma2 family endonuclease
MVKKNQKCPPFPERERSSATGSFSFWQASPNAVGTGQREVYRVITASMLSRDDVVGCRAFGLVISQRRRERSRGTWVVLGRRVACHRRRCVASCSGMSSLVERPSIRRNLYPISVATYHTLGELGLVDEDVELLQGMIVTKMPKSELHVFVVRRLLRLLSEAAARAGLEILKEDPLTIGDSEPEPDLALVPATILDARAPAPHPSTAALIIEVAVTTYERDLAKGEIYAGAGVPEFWIVRPDQRCIEIHRQPDGVTYGTRVVVSAGEVLTSPVLPLLEFAVSDLFPAQDLDRPRV